MNIVRERYSMLFFNRSTEAGGRIVAALVLVLRLFFPSVLFVHIKVR